MSLTAVNGHRPMEDPGLAQKRSLMNSMLEQRKLLLGAQQSQPLASTSAARLPDLSSAPPVFDFLPGGLPVDPAFTTARPLRKSDNLPEITQEEQEQLKQWISKDHAYEELLSFQNGLADTAIVAHTTDMQQRSDWLGNKPSPHAGTAWSYAPEGGHFRLRLPHERLRDLSHGKRKNRVETVKPIKKLEPQVLASFAEDEEWLVPIRLEFDHETQKIRDVFTWNLRDSHISLEAFVKTLCEDLQLPPIPFHRELLHQINTQLEDCRRAAYRENVFPHRTDDEIHEDEIHDDIDEHFWSSWRKRIKRNEKGKATASELDYKTGELKAHEELRILIKLDITFNQMHLTDQFEWDIADPHNVPEHFARVYAADLGLSGDVVTAIAHSIREQAESYAKSLGLIEHQPGNPVVHEDLRYSFLPPIADAVRADSSLTGFTPQINYFSPEELLHAEREREREARRKRRQTRGRQVVSLPDREPLKTHRTLMPAPGAVQTPGRLDEENDQYIPASLPVARPYDILFRHHGEPKPVPMLREDSPPAARTKFGPKEKERLKHLTMQGRRKLVKGPSVDRASSIDLNGPPSPSGSSEWHPKIESGAGTPPGGDVSAPLLEPQVFPKKQKSRGTPKKRTGFGSVPSAEAVASQHENYINGIWHCANCGGPEGVVAGRRVGPRGRDTLCGECGKYYHRNRKSRPCVYNTSAEHHLALRQQREEAIAHVGDTSRETDTYAPRNSPSELTDESEDEPIRRSARPPQPSQRAEAQRASVAAAPSHSSSLKVTLSTGGGSAPHSAAVRQLPPAWMIDAVQALRLTKPDDRFDIIPRPKQPTDASTGVEWRIRCADCPGKLYTPGPDESLDNFSVHLKNRAHRANVDKRLGRVTQDPA